MYASVIAREQKKLQKNYEKKRKHVSESSDSSSSDSDMTVAVIDPPVVRKKRKKSVTSNETSPEEKAYSKAVNREHSDTGSDSDSDSWKTYVGRNLSSDSIKRKYTVECYASTASEIRNRKKAKSVHLSTIAFKYLHSKKGSKKVKNEMTKTIVWNWMWSNPNQS